MNLGLIILIIFIVLVIGRRLILPKIRGRQPKLVKRGPIKNRSLYTVLVFARLSTKRFFRDRLAIFFGILFPLIFLFVFGGIFGKSTHNVSFSVAIINNSKSSYAQQFI